MVSFLKKGIVLVSLLGCLSGITTPLYAAPQEKKQEEHKQVSSLVKTLATRGQKVFHQNDKQLYAAQFHYFDSDARVSVSQENTTIKSITFSFANKEGQWVIYKDQGALGKLDPQDVLTVDRRSLVDQLKKKEFQQLHTKRYQRFLGYVKDKIEQTSIILQATKPVKQYLEEKGNSFIYTTPLPTDTYRTGQGLAKQVNNNRVEYLQGRNFSMNGREVSGGPNSFFYKIELPGKSKVVFEDVFPVGVGVEDKLYINDKDESKRFSSPTYCLNFGKTFYLPLLKKTKELLSL